MRNAVLLLLVAFNLAGCKVEYSKTPKIETVSQPSAFTDLTCNEPDSILLFRYQPYSQSEYKCKNGRFVKGEVKWHFDDTTK